MSAQTDGPTDECLITDTLAGDDEAFAVLVRRHKGKVFGIAARFARNDHDLEDLAQEVFIRAYRKLGKFRGDAPFEHWLSRIAVRSCYDYLRRTRPDKQNVSLDSMNMTITDIAANKQVSAHEVREVLNLALGHLPAKDRLVISLLELEEKSVREVAALTGWSEANVKVRAFRARKALEKALRIYHEL
jgi:RNA polymerase sigma-70 factor (ECF subfamily)